MQSAKRSRYLKSLEPWPQNAERILGKLIEILKRPDLDVAVSRSHQRSSP
jgi:hypothetical protein